METISLTVPLYKGPLRRAAAMLNGLADDVETAGSAPYEGFVDKVVETVATSAGVAVEDLRKPLDDTLTAEEVAEGGAQLLADASKPAEEAVDPAVVFGAATEPVAPPADTGVELDGLGLPWDERINTDTRTKLKSDDSWKLKRNVDPELVEQVRAELKAAMGHGMTTDEAATLEAPAATEETVVSPVPPAETAEVTTFPELVKYITGKCNAGVVQPQQIENVLAKYKIASLPLVAARPDLVPAIHADLVMLWPTTD